VQKKTNQPNAGYGLKIVGRAFIGGQKTAGIGTKSVLNPFFKNFQLTKSLAGACDG